MAKSLEELAEKNGWEIGTMHIDNVVSPFPRDIRIPLCPKCGSYLFLFHSEKKQDPFIGAKVIAGILAERNIKPRSWIATCWTENCDYFLVFKQKDLATCPECNRYFMEYYSLYDHMKFQCTDRAKDNQLIRKAGADMYIADLVALEFKEEGTEE